MNVLPPHALPQGVAQPAQPLPEVPSRAYPTGAAPLERLLDEPIRRVHVRGPLTPRLLERYAGDLAIPLRHDRPTLVANFVETLDGVVAFDRHEATGGGDVSGFSPTDRFVMGLLRALADVVLLGGSAIRRSTIRTWSPASVFPSEADAFRELRSTLGLAPVPTTLVVTATGELDPRQPVFLDPAHPIVVAAPAKAAARLRARGFADHVGIEQLDREGPGAMVDLVDVVSGLGAKLIVSEAGPHLFGELVRAERVDELFLTIAPQLAGRGPVDERLGLVEGVALWPEHSRWTHLVSLRRAGHHLFARYRFA